MPSTFDFTMPDGSTQNFTMGPGFDAQPPADQEATLHGVTLALAKAHGSFDNPQTPPPDRGFGSAARHSLATLTGGLGATGALAIGGLKNSGSDTGASAGKWLDANAPDLQNAVADPRGYVPGASDVAQNIHDGNYSAIPANALRAGVDALGPMAGVVAGGFMGSLGGPMGAAGGAMAASAAMNAGRNVEATGSVGKGLGLTALQAPLDAFGARGGGALIAQLPTAALRAAARVTREGGAQAGMETAREAITDGHLDPDQIAAAGVMGMAGRGLGETPGIVKAAGGAVGSGVKAGAEGLMSRYGVEQPRTEAAGRAWQMASQHLDETRKVAEAAGRRPSDAELAEGAKRGLADQAAVTLRQLRVSGVISPEDHTELMVGLKNAGETGIGRGGQDLGFRKIDSLDALDQGTKDNLKAVIGGVDTLGKVAGRGRTAGPLEVAGKWAGQMGTLGGGLASASPLAIAAGLGLGGKSVAGSVGGAVGRGLDKALGLSRGEVVFQGKAADRAFGPYTGPGLVERGRALTASVGDSEGSLFDQIRANRVKAGGAEVFDPADTANATPAQKARWADTIDQADRANAQFDAGAVQGAVPNGPSALEKARQISSGGVPERATLRGNDPTTGRGVGAGGEVPGGLLAGSGEVPTGLGLEGRAESPPGYGERADSHILAHGPLAYASIALNDRMVAMGGRPVSSSDLREAIGHLHDNGTLGRMLKDPSRSAELAEALAHGDVPTEHPMSRSLGQALILQVAKNRGVLDDMGFQRRMTKADALSEVIGNDEGPLSKTSSTGNNVDAKGEPIRSRAAYDNAMVSQNRAVAEGLATANAQGFTGLATVIDQIARVSKTGEKARIAEGYLEGLERRREPIAKVELAYARTILSPTGRIMKGTE